MFVDVHSHLTKEDFEPDLPEVIARAEEAGLKAIIVNGLEPVSNRYALALAEKYSIVQAAMGIYPLEAINHLNLELPFPLAKFSVAEAIDEIRVAAQQKKIIAIGECGLDGYWVKEDTFAEQERVFIELIQIAVENHLPLIIHTRKCEDRSMDILRDCGVKLVDFHCFGGKSRNAIRAAETEGWYFSIPANARKNESFTKMLKGLPPERILTETDCPYLAPVRGERNEPKHVVGTIEYLAELRAWSKEEAQLRVYQNYCDLFLRDRS